MTAASLPREMGGVGRGKAVWGVVPAGCLAVLGLSHGSFAGPAPAARFQFDDVAAKAGLTRVTAFGRPGKDHLLDSSGAGIAFLDYDRDGRLDVYVVNGWRLDGSRVVEKGRNALYRGLPDGTFRDATDDAGVGGEGLWGSGVTVADYDGDGWPDIFLTGFGPSVLYRNLADGRFRNVAAEVGVESPGWNTGAAFFDADRDGDLDLYVASYIDCTLQDVLEAKPTLDWRGLEKVAFGPFGLKGAPDHFFRSEGGKRFVDATAEAGMQDRALGFGFGVRAADYDGDGILDLFTTNFSEDFSTLYHGVGNGLFEDVARASGVGPATFRFLKWGAALADLDNDADLDLLQADGHIYPQIDRHPEIIGSFAQKSLLLENLSTPGAPAFRDVTEDAGPGFQSLRSSRGLAVGDFDDDGRLDILMAHLDAPPTLLHNVSQAGAWLTVVCEDEHGGTNPIGTVVIVKAAGRSQWRDIAAGDSFLSTHDPRPHFGLGTARKVDVVEVTWPDGTRSIRRDVAEGQQLRIRKGT